MTTPKPFMQRLQARLGAKRFLSLLGAYPPYIGAGVSVKSVEGDIDVITVQMKFNALNRNFMGTQFGGSLYSMCDPWFMFMLFWKLGEPFVVWDKSASIQFIKPGKTKVTARFEITPAQVQAVREEVARVGKAEPQFTVDVIDAHGIVVAKVIKGLHVHDPRMKKPKK